MNQFCRISGSIFPPDCFNVEEKKGDTEIPGSDTLQ